jgi:segregation and condensation protein B
MDQETDQVEKNETHDATDANIETQPALESEESFELEMRFLDQEKQDENDWQERTGLNRDSLCGAIETIIFMSDRPVPIIKLRNLLDPHMPVRVVHECLERLQSEYEAKHHGLRLAEVAEGYQFRTKATYARFVQDLFKVNSLVLTPSALEVLAIIAYKQPVHKGEVDKIRGVDSSHIVRTLMDKRLVKIVGRSEDEVGRPSLYATTPEFLEVFNLPNLQAMPPMHELEELASANDVGQISDIRSVCGGDKSRFIFDEIDELDALAESIRTIPTDTSFTESLKIQERRRIDEHGAPVKTAFELLEEHIARAQIVTHNREAVESQPIGGEENVTIISDFSAGPFNVPRDDEDFAMIDLETGLPLENAEKKPVEGFSTLDAKEYLDSSALDENEEARALGDALDEAFERLTGQNLKSLEGMPNALVADEELDSNLLDHVDDAWQKLEETRLQISAEAEELDMDLSFLEQNQEGFQLPKNTEFEQSPESEDEKI